MSSIFLSIFFLTSFFHDPPIDLGYVEISEIHPGQMRYSREKVIEKIPKAIEKGLVIEKKEGYQLKYDGGRSIVPLGKALPVVLGPDGYVLVDGHHHILESLHFHAQTVPVKQIADLSQMSSEEFWKKAEELGFAHLNNLRGEKQIPPKDFNDLEDDPCRYFATMTARRYSADFSSSSGAEYPLWIKVGRDIPFIEFYISDALRQQGVIYDYAMGSRPSEEFVEKARQALINAKIPGLRVIASRIHYKEIQPHEGTFSSDSVQDSIQFKF